MTASGRGGCGESIRESLSLEKTAPGEGHLPVGSVDVSSATVNENSTPGKSILLRSHWKKSVPQKAEPERAAEVARPEPVASKPSPRAQAGESVRKT